jgi:hypothetical protein
MARMKAAIHCTALVTLSITALAARAVEGHWRPLLTRPGGGPSLSGMWSAGQDILAAGDAIYHSRDGGATWSQNRAATNVLANRVEAVWGRGAHDLYAVGFGGQIWRSQDGDTWAAVQSPTQEPLDAIRGAASGPTIAVGDHGAIVSSRDGAHWRREKSGTREMLRAVWVGDDGRAVATGENDCVLARTSDGHWRRRKTPEHDYWVKIIEEPGGALLVLGTGGHLLRSTDRGTTWTSAGTLPLGMRSYCDALARGAHGLFAVCHVAEPGTEVMKEPPMKTVLMQSPDASKPWSTEPLDAAITSLWADSSGQLYGIGGGLWRRVD